jgi:hypothetical protein
MAVNMPVQMIAQLDPAVVALAFAKPDPARARQPARQVLRRRRASHPPLPACC